MNLVVNHIIEYETFVDSIYELNGNKYFGFGFDIRYYQLPDTILFNDSKSLVADIIQTNIINLERAYPNLEYHEYLALSTLAYRIGINSLHKSKLIKTILRGEDVEDEWMKWSYFRNKKHIKVTKRCIFEYQLFTGNFEYILENNRV